MISSGQLCWVHWLGSPKCHTHSKAEFGNQVGIKALVPSVARVCPAEDMALWTTSAGTSLALASQCLGKRSPSHYQDLIHGAGSPGCRAHRHITSLLGAGRQFHFWGQGGVTDTLQHSKTITFSLPPVNSLSSVNLFSYRGSFLLKRNIFSY